MRILTRSLLLNLFSIISSTAVHNKNSSIMFLRKIPQSKLGVSEPDPSWFGNPSNIKSPSWTNTNWLKSRFHFSFAEYSNPRNQNFGVLRVMNDDLVQPDRGFGAHPHRNVEICTYIVNGSLTHQDNMGTKETLNRGAIQFMTAGSGVTHSEHNLDKSNPLRFIQMWLTTRTNNLSPNYGSSVGNQVSRKNQWFHMVSDVKSSSATAIKINQDANIYVTEIENGKSTDFSVGVDRQVYLLCVEGQASVSFGDSCVTLDQHDASEVLKGGSLKVQATGSESIAHMLMIEMAYEGPGRSDL